MHVTLLFINRLSIVVHLNDAYEYKTTTELDAVLKSNEYRCNAHSKHTVHTTQDMREPVVSFSVTVTVGISL